jgi:hypothetical protein|tara:strand:- start:148 stop:357 length:210 start_codon:yes stop_codon:yes gene_type:complete
MKQASAAAGVTFVDIAALGRDASNAARRAAILGGLGCNNQDDVYGHRMKRLENCIVKLPERAALPIRRH